MFSMSIFGVSIIIILGIINLFLLIFQLLSGLHIIQVKIGIHKKTGITFFITGLLHGILGILANL
jgi:hypothetical protein